MPLPLPLSLSVSLSLCLSRFDPRRLIEYIGRCRCSPRALLYTPFINLSPWLLAWTRWKERPRSTANIVFRWFAKSGHKVWAWLASPLPTGFAKFRGEEIHTGERTRWTITFPLGWRDFTLTTLFTVSEEKSHDEGYISLDVIKSRINCVDFSIWCIIYLKNSILSHVHTLFSSRNKVYHLDNN